MDSIDTWSVSDLLLLPDFCKIISLTPIPCWSWHDIWFVQNIRFQMKSALFSNWCMHLFVKNIERSNYEHCMGVVKLLRYYQRWRLIKGGLVKPGNAKKNSKTSLNSSLIDCDLFTGLIWPWSLKELRHSWKCMRRWWSLGRDVYNSLTVKISNNQIH